jgi:1,4-dihydroxy-2-naphthoyl-CoA hydrolase
LPTRWARSAPSSIYRPARTVTIESKTNFLGAAPAGTRVTGETTPFHRGRTTMVWQTLIKSENGKLCAVVTQTQMVLPALEKTMQ